MKKIIAAPLVFVLFAVLARAENATAPTVADKAASYMDARLKIGRFSGTVLVAKDGQVMFTRGYGFANVEHEVPNGPKTKFRLASVSKQFVATGIMLLEADGKLRDVLCDLFCDLGRRHAHRSHVVGVAKPQVGAVGLHQAALRVTQGAAGAGKADVLAITPAAAFHHQRSREQYDRQCLRGER